MYLKAEFGRKLVSKMHVRHNKPMDFKDFRQDEKLWKNRHRRFKDLLP